MIFLAPRNSSLQSSSGYRVYTRGRYPEWLSPRCRTSCVSFIPRYHSTESRSKLDASKRLRRPCKCSLRARGLASRRSSSRYSLSGLPNVSNPNLKSWLRTMCVGSLVNPTDFLAGLRRSGAYRAHIRSVHCREKCFLLTQLVVLPHVESSFNPGAYSFALMQQECGNSRAQRARRFMRIDHIVDERMDPYIAAEAAMSLLEYNYRVLGTWPLALDSLQSRGGGIARAVRETGSSDIEELLLRNIQGQALRFCLA